MAKKPSKKLTAVRDPFTKAQLLAAIAEDTDLSKQQVAAVFGSLEDLMHRHLKSRSAGVFNLLGLAKFSVVKKPAQKARKGINPFTKEETVFKAKPASRVVKIRPLKRLKDLAS